MEHYEATVHKWGTVCKHPLVRRRVLLGIGLFLLVAASAVSRLKRRRIALALLVVVPVALAGVVLSEREPTSGAASTASTAAPAGEPPRALADRTLVLANRVARLEAVAAGLEQRDERKKTRVSPSVQADFERLQVRLPGRVGVVFGAPSGPTVELGSLRSGPAWSTMKVPVSIAYARDHPGVTDTMRRAITISDNAAAMSLWELLGSTDRQRVAKVEWVLAEAGDRTTRVQGRVVRAGFTPFGQTNWSLRAQQSFAKRLPCVAAAARVRSLMAQVDGSQSWGLGRIGARPEFKGGWGPDLQGAYLVRQFGLIHVRSGTVAVAIAAQPSDGSFSTGIRYLDLLAAFVEKHALGGSPSC